MRYLFHAILVVGAISLNLGLSQPAWADEYQEAGLNLEIRERELGLAGTERNLEFENRMRELELEGRRAEIELDLEARRVEIDIMRGATSQQNDSGGALVLLCIVVNILMAVWVYTDNRRRDAGHGIWIVITLLVGFFGALVYAVIRHGDMTASPPAPTRSTAAAKK